MRDRPVQAAVGRQLPQQAEPPSLGREVGEERAEEAMVPGQELVGALPVQQHLDAVLRGQAHHIPLREDARRAERLILLPHQSRH